MPTVGAFEAKTKLSELLDAVERGEEIIITRRGQPIARLVGMNQGDGARSGSLVDDIRQTREQLGQTGISIADIVAWKAEGRR
ncbi:MAG: type II toxin-antitoxin system prevent-host-death family antitoxin [Rhodanobacteraceae bacterium]|nr:type II toxin-antitoxin system prevent-host-death family antitoxin [Rhodanobacteraceae bacterium]